MLYSVVLKLKSGSDTSPTQAYHNYALLLDLLRGVSPDLAAQIHDMSGPKPVTVSPRWGRSTPWIRFTFLDETFFAGFAHAVMRLGVGGIVTLGSGRFEVEELITQPKDSPWSRYDDFQGLWDRASREKEITLGFRSPTAFRSSGRNLVFPQPELVFGSLIARWNAYSEINPGDSLGDEWLSKVVVSRHSLNTRLLDFGSYRQVGFTGKCTFELKDSAAEEAARWMNALADFAFYAGVGAKTTMGMGQTRRIRTRQGGANG